MMVELPSEAMLVDVLPEPLPACVLVVTPPPGPEVVPLTRPPPAVTEVDMPPALVEALLGRSSPGLRSTTLQLLVEDELELPPELAELLLLELVCAAATAVPRPKTTQA